MKKKVKLILLLSGFIFTAYGQSDSTSNQGEIVSGEVIIQKEKTINLPKAQKLYYRVKNQATETGPLSLSLIPIEPDLNWPDYEPEVSYTPYSKNYPSAEYQNYLRLGYGNYASPLAELGIFHQVDQIELNSVFFHESFGSGPVNDSNSGNSFTTWEVSASRKFKSIEFTPFFQLKRNGYTFYGNSNRVRSGFPPENADDARWNKVNAGIEVQGSTDAVKYYLLPEYLGVNQKLIDEADINDEQLFHFVGGFEYTLDQTFKTGLDVEAYRSSYESGITSDRSLITVSPWLSYTKELLTLKGGFQLASSESGDIDDSGFYPLVKATLGSDEWTLFAEWKGGIQWSGVQQLLSQNEFLDDSLILLNTELKSRIMGGLKGSLTENLALKVYASYSIQDGFPVFIPSSSDSSRFTITYDAESIDQFQLSGLLTYSPSVSSIYSAEIEVNSYSVNTLDRPWHLPTVVFKAHSSHTLKEKLIISGTILFMGGLRAPADVSFGIVDLDSFLDLGLSLNYLITKRASAFVNVNNILNNEYERYLGYPVRGLSFKLGGQYRF